MTTRLQVESVPAEGWSVGARERRRVIIDRMRRGMIDPDTAMSAIQVLVAEEAERPRTKEQRERDDTTEALREVYSDDE